jgi:hypothetical protein
MMTVTTEPERQSADTVESTDSSSTTPAPTPIRRARPRSVEGEEAYLRSAMERARIDIAAGW